jgi:hypothetical protein
MYKTSVFVGYFLLIWLLLLTTAPMAQAQAGTQALNACAELAFSTEEDFLTRGPVPPDGNPIISDGDLLSSTGGVCLRNKQLLAKWDLRRDLGLDAADVLSVESGLVAFSTELDDPQGRFKSGDLLFTNGAAIPNLALLSLFQIGHDMGLDAVHFVGKPGAIQEFASFAATKGPEYWLSPGTLTEGLTEYGIDIWFSTEATERLPDTPPMLDGDLLSAKSGIHVLRQDQFLPASVPAGIPNRGVDFGVDAFTASRGTDRSLGRFSTEILFRGKPSFTDGDVLRVVTATVEFSNTDLVASFEPAARFLSLDALYMKIDGGGDNGTDDEGNLFLPTIFLAVPAEAR